MFHVGQKVVFVRGAPVPGEWKTLSCNLKNESVYTIREIDPLYIPYFEMAGVRVEEDVYPAVKWKDQWIEPAVLACHFRPLVDRKTDIGLLTALLDPTNHRKLVDG